MSNTTMSEKIICPICQNQHGLWGKFPRLFRCETCGTFSIEENLGIRLERPGYSDWNLTAVQRAVLAHEKHLWDLSPSSKSDSGIQHLFRIDEGKLTRIKNNGRLPSRAQQAVNLIRFVGDEVTKTAQDVQELPKNIHVIIGDASLESTYRLATELVNENLLTSNVGTIGFPVSSVNLTLKGWEQYEAERRGRLRGDYGFLAMKSDNTLDRFMKEVVKPTVEEETGYELRDLRDASRAGLIDNIMVTAIRDARFVIVDLTHDNHGAYWEAGYAEGLGKPVIYICEREKFDNEGTHFDTNHYTTVLWSTADVLSFRQELTATLRRSLAVLP